MASLAFLRFSTCEDLIKEYKYDKFPNKENSLQNYFFIFGFMKLSKFEQDLRKSL